MPMRKQSQPPPASPRAAAELALRSVRDELGDLSKDVERAAAYLAAEGEPMRQVHGELSDLSASLRTLKSYAARIAIQLEDARHG